MANTTESRAQGYIDQDLKYGAHNYAPLPVVLERGEGIFVWDVDGTRYFDMLSAYSAVNQGHNHPAIVTAAKNQLDKLALTSRAFHNSVMGELLEKLAKLTGKDKILLMNSGAEGVETAIKAMRKWGYEEKGIPGGQAEIVVCESNFHGRTTTIAGFSSDPGTSSGFGPATPGFVRIPYNDIEALKALITPNTCGFLVEPVQGEAGVIIPGAEYLSQVREICSSSNVLLCADEIQTGLGRTGKMFCCEHAGVEPDIYILGKALSGGLYPVSAVACNDDVMKVFTPGTHGSTYGGNPLACAIASAALDVIVNENLVQRSEELGARFRAHLDKLDHPKIKERRNIGLMLALEFTEPVAKAFCKALMKSGVLAKDTHETTVRFAPPLVITEEQVDEACEIIARTISEF